MKEVDLRCPHCGEKIMMYAEEGKSSNNEMTQGVIKFLDDFFGEKENWIWRPDVEIGTREISHWIRKWGKEHERWDFVDVCERTIKRRLSYYFDLRGMKVHRLSLLFGRKEGGYRGFMRRSTDDSTKEISKNQQEELDNIPEM